MSTCAKQKMQGVILPTMRFCSEENCNRPSIGHYHCPSCGIGKEICKEHEKNIENIAIKCGLKCLTDLIDSVYDCIKNKQE